MTTFLTIEQFREQYDTDLALMGQEQDNIEQLAYCIYKMGWFDGKKQGIEDSFRAVQQVTDDRLRQA